MDFNIDKNWTMEEFKKICFDESFKQNEQIFKLLRVNNIDYFNANYSVLYALDYAKFEYIRRNENYIEDCFDLLKTGDFIINEKVPGKIEPSNHEWVQSLSKDWDILYCVDPRFTFPDERDVQILNREDRMGCKVTIKRDVTIIKEWKWCSQDPSTRKFLLIYALGGRNVTSYDGYSTEEIIGGVHEDISDQNPTKLVYLDNNETILFSDFIDSDTTIKIEAIQGEITGETIESLSNESQTPVVFLNSKSGFTNKIKTKAELDSVITVINPQDDFKIWRDDNDALSINWDKNNWELVAINKQETYKNVVEKIKNIFKGESTGRKPSFGKCIQELHIYDLSKSGKTHLEIYMEIFGKNKDLTNQDKKKCISEIFLEAKRMIDGKYRKIKRTIAP